MVKKESKKTSAKKTSKKKVTKEQTEKKEKKDEKPKTTKKKTSKKKSLKKCITARGKRKTAIARASIIKGKGNIRLNKISVTSLNNKYVRDLILEPVRLAGERALSVDIFVNVSGGGTLGQAQASRTAIARALVEYFDDDSLKSLYLERDRSLLVEDSRRVESKKFRGPKARARYQKSYR